MLLEGRAELLGDDAPRSTLPAYAEKYAALMARLGMAADWHAAQYNQAIRVTIDRQVRF